MSNLLLSTQAKARTNPDRRATHNSLLNLYRDGAQLRHRYVDKTFICIPHYVCLKYCDHHFTQKRVLSSPARGRRCPQILINLYRRTGCGNLGPQIIDNFLHNKWNGLKLEQTVFVLAGNAEHQRKSSAMLTIRGIQERWLSGQILDGSVAAYTCFQLDKLLIASKCQMPDL